MVVAMKKYMKLAVVVIIFPMLLTGCSEVFERSAKLAARQVALDAARKANEDFPTTTDSISEPERKLKEASRVARVKIGSLPICKKRRANSSDCSFLKLMDSNFNKTDLNSYLFKGADLSGSTFIGANLQNADLSNANLENCDLSRADLTGANLNGAKLTGATMPDGTIHE